MEERNKAFSQLKKVMSQTRILVMPDFDIEFEVQIDANDDAGVN
jgi:hypothetical protein